ncbi:hypothetical protein OAJ59_00115 [bacterium]|nr:hypothetical protein [bacterium]
MDKDMKIVVTVFTTILTISIGVFIAWQLIDAEYARYLDTGDEEDWWTVVTVAVIYFIFILPCSIFIGIFAGLNLVPFLISKKERESIRSSSYKVKGNPFGSKTAPTLICRKCNKMNPDSWQWQYCRKCGTSLKNALIFSNRRQNSGVYEPNPPSAKETKSALKEFKE